MEELVKTQHTLLDQVQTIKRNYAKTSVARRSIGYVSGRLSALESIWESFQGNDIEIRSYDKYKDSPYATDEVYDACEQEYSLMKGDFQDRLIVLKQDAANANPVNQNPHANPLEHPPTNNANAGAQVQIQQQPLAIRLPQITLPTFAGDYASWTEFYDMFVSLIHSNANLSNVQKLHYLKSNLTDKAADFLRHTPITNDNYATAWTALQTRYANKRILVETQLKLLFNQPSYQSESASNIRIMIDTTQECLNALRVLEIDVSTWDPMILFMLVQKLSKDSHAAWELNQEGEAELASYTDFMRFLENRFRMLEALSSRSPVESNSKPSIRQVKSHASISTPTSPKSCPICSDSHYIRSCPRFLQLNVDDRRNILKQNRICFNCLVPGHLVPECKNRMNCQSCNKRHHTLLHSTTVAPSSVGQPHNFRSSSIAQSASTPQHVNSNRNNDMSFTSHIAASTSTTSSSSPAHVLLATACVTGVSTTGAFIPLRALIDQGSQISLLTENAVQLLRLKSQPVNYALSGIGNTSAGCIRKVVHFQVRSPHRNDISLNLNAFVIKTVTGILPPTRCSVNTWPHLSNLKLADPSFNLPGPIDILFGADVYSDIIQDGLLRGPAGAPIAQSTIFGWILSGSTKTHDIHNGIAQPYIGSLHTCIDIDSRLKTFWESEERPVKESIYTDEEAKCEEHFTKNHRKSSDGRYVVRLPLRANSQLGESRQTAQQRLLQLERRLRFNTKLKSSYIDFMREYISLGHMKLSEPYQSSQSPRYYIPHHAVHKESSTTTKVRVVFDASSKSSNGVALNDLMLIGPKIQDDLSVILLRWRKYPIAFTADVQKMYRQILVHPADHHLQHILWRESPDQPISEYALQTVTYGTSCAPHLAVRTLRQLALDQASTYPIASQIAQTDFYVDDLMSGAYTESDALSIRQDICSLMDAGGFKLRKWVSNYAPLLNEIDSDDREIQHPLNIELNDTVTALGIVWSPARDRFQFKLNLQEIKLPITKRNILSEISKLFDPLGWLAPIIIRAKMLMQQLWLQGVSWDDALSEPISKLFTTIRSDLFNVNNISIPRWIHHQQNALELHGFSDASTHAYAASIYARIKNPDGSYHTTLLTAKTRVAPLKQVSIPKLELCGAVLVAELLQWTQKHLHIDDTNVFAWTDSSIVLHWLHAQPSRWKTYIANRVSIIQQIVPMSCWRHVPTADNPADCASRGLDSRTLKTFDLWWNGPSWLRQSPDTWPNFKHKPRPEDVSEHERSFTSHLTVPTDSSLSFSTLLLESFSSLDRLLRVFTYCKRFVNILRKHSSPNLPISASETQIALNFFIISSQRTAFHTEIHHIKNKKSLSPKSRLLSLNPIIDENGILRVGGRLENTQMSYEEKHPVILSPNCHLTTLIVRKHHFATMHGGPQLVSGLIRKTYWIINSRSMIRSLIHRCITCHRYKAASATQLMGNLPQPRVKLTRAFTHTGVDYAGPIDLRMSKGRGNKSYKGYISLFICLCTKAIHIEAVSDLTSAGFIAAYRRFVARRGLPAHMYSDNGTNFVGAVKSLRKQQDSLLQIKDDVINVSSKSNTEWHFIPPSSPHFGGLWEAGVKSVKFHLKRSLLGNSKLTYEELSTLLIQIEACLNSRPLTQLSSDPSDLSALTPGHFLTGDALLAPPDHNTEPQNIATLTRWQLVQRLYQSFSIRWKSEYLSRLQQRPKWTKTTPNIQINDLVLLKESSHPPSNWPLARVIQIHPGDDGLVRVVTVRTQTSEFKRCITKICPLPN